MFNTKGTNYYKKMKAGEEDQWPPKYWKFQLETDGNPSVKVAFTDPRRFGRIRLVDCLGRDIRNVSPLAENPTSESKLPRSNVSAAASCWRCPAVSLLISPGSALLLVVPPTGEVLGRLASELPVFHRGWIPLH